eukprot:SM000050S17070  [mRNA]  locus=s50:711612:714256:- [translate_table: standard]
MAAATASRCCPAPSRSGGTAGSGSGSGDGGDCQPSHGELPPVSHGDVSEYYGSVLQSKGDLQTSACMVQGEETRHVRLLLRNIHPVVLDKFYGCGSPIPPLLEGATVLDLGCGTGRDVYTVAQLVGPSGKVIGIDMTDEQLSVAKEYEAWHQEKFGLAKPNTSFRKAYIEDLASAGVADESVDLVISNCVVNLASSKEAVLKEVARILKPGGELYFADVFCDRRVPEHLQKDKVLYGECLSGALYVEDFRRLMALAGLGAWGVVTERCLEIKNVDIEHQVGDIKFYSLTVRAIKLPPTDQEDILENYGQVAVYDGSIVGCESTFVLDVVRSFPKGERVPVDAVTAAMLACSRYGQAFQVSPKGPHQGKFTAWSGGVASVAGSWTGPAALAGGQSAACCC